MSKQGESQACEYRWDVEVAFAEKQYGDKFMKQWRKVLKAQRLSALGAKVPPRSARYQICGNGELTAVQTKQADVAKVLGGVVGDGAGRGGESEIRKEAAATDTAEKHPLGWEGVRVWMTFEREAVENALLPKKPRAI